MLLACQKFVVAHHFFFQLARKERTLSACNALTRERGVMVGAAETTACRWAFLRAEMQWLSSALSKGPALKADILDQGQGAFSLPTPFSSLLHLALQCPGPRAKYWTRAMLCGSSFHSNSHLAFSPLCTDVKGSLLKWKLHDGKRKDTGAAVSIFAWELTPTSSPDDYAAAKNALKRLRTARHPHVLQFIDGTEPVQNSALCLRSRSRLRYHRSVHPSLTSRTLPPGRRREDGQGVHSDRARQDT